MTRVTGIGVGDHVVAVEGDAADAVEAGATSGNNFEIEDRRRRRKSLLCRVCGAGTYRRDETGHVKHARQTEESLTV